MKPSIILLLLMPLMSGCSFFWDNDNQWAYQCPDGYSFNATFDNDGKSVLMEHGDGKIRLDQVEAASGGRYSDGFTTLWAKGAGAMVFYQGEVMHSECVGDRIQP